MKNDQVKIQRYNNGNEWNEVYTIKLGGEYFSVNLDKIFRPKNKYRLIIWLEGSGPYRLHIINFMNGLEGKGLKVGAAGRANGFYSDDLYLMYEEVHNLLRLFNNEANTE